MPEPLLENSLKLNQKSKEMLQKLKINPDPSVLYCLQLMNWALESGKVRAHDSRLTNALEAMQGWKQRDALDFLRLAEDGEDYDPVLNLNSITDPSELAERLLDCLDSQLNLRLPDYPKAMPITHMEDSKKRAKLEEPVTPTLENQFFWPNGGVPKDYLRRYSWDEDLDGQCGISWEKMLDFDESGPKQIRKVIRDLQKIAPYVRWRVSWDGADFDDGGGVQWRTLCVPNSQFTEAEYIVEKYRDEEDLTGFICMHVDMGLFQSINGVLTVDPTVQEFYGALSEYKHALSAACGANKDQDQLKELFKRLADLLARLYYLGNGLPQNIFSDREGSDNSFDRSEELSFGKYDTFFYLPNPFRKEESNEDDLPALLCAIYEDVGGMEAAWEWNGDRDPDALMSAICEWRIYFKYHRHDILHALTIVQAAIDDLSAIRRRDEYLNVPKPDRGAFTPNPHTDRAWAEGTLKDGKPFRAECWLENQFTYLTLCLSTLGIEDASKQDLKNLLISEGLVEFDDEGFIRGGFEGINVDANKIEDASHNEMWSITVIVGDEDGTYVHDGVKLKAYPRKLFREAP